MEFDALRAAVVPGAAVVGRWPGVVCVAECADRQVLRQLLDVCAAASGPEPGRALARRLTMWLGGSDAPGDGLRFGTVAVTTGDGRSAGLRGDQWAVFLFGPVGLVVPDRQVALSGAQAVAWTDRLLPCPDVPVVLALEGGPIPPGVIDGVHDLRSGVVPGAGAVLVPGGGDGFAADGAEDAVRHRHDDPLWAEPAERERSRWAGAPEPALAAPADGLFHSGGDGSANGVSGRGPRDDGDFGADLRTDLDGDRGRLGDRGRAHLRPVPSNGSGHRGRAPRSTPRYDLGRFGIGQGRSRHDTLGPGAGAEPGGDSEGSGHDGPGTPGPGEQATDQRPAFYPEMFHETPARAGEASGGAGFGAGVGDAVDTGMNGRPAFGAEAGHLNGADVLNRTDVLDSASNATVVHSLPTDNGDPARPDRVEGQWFSTRDEGIGGTETELGAVSLTDTLQQDTRRPRHGRQDDTTIAVPAEPEGGEEPAPGTPRFGVPRVVPPVAALVPAPVPTPAPAPEPGQPAAAPLRAERVLGVLTGESPRPPLEAGRPVGADTVPDTQADPLDETQVRGHLCQRGHLNDPRLTLCAFCGVHIEEASAQLVAGPRPALGLLVFDDGTTYTVDAEYLVGRMPEGDPRVAAGALRSLSVEDSSGAVSRVHAEVRVTGWDVVLGDAGSRNGTFVSGPGEADWTQLPAGQTHRLVPGTRVRLGGRSFLFESPSGAR